ncbi:MAG: methyl-accepting chemotaxis protein [Treponema sp.]|nr:methyl-accepting chemotaxis protein [Treponema sp.]
MGKMSNLTARFVPVTLLCGYAGALSLRWHQLSLLYRTIDQYFAGIASTLGAVTILGLVFAFFFAKALAPINSLGNRIEKGEPITPEDSILAGKVNSKINLLVFIENSLGFIIGQTAVSIIDFVNGVYIFTPSRFAIIFAQAVCIGTIISLYEIYYFDLVFIPFREKLQIHNIKTYGTKKNNYIAHKILLIAVITLFYMGVNAYSTGYGLLYGENITPETNLMKEFITNGTICIIINFIECMGLFVIVCFEMKRRLQSITNVVQELEQSGDLSRRINISINDDIGLLTSSLNGLTDKLSSTINSLKDETNTVATSAQILNQSSSRSINALDSMKNAVQTIEMEEKRTNEIINLTYNDIESLRNSAKQVEEQILNQSLAMERASASVEETAMNLVTISDTTKKADTITESLRSASDAGMNSINTAEEAISLIQQSSEEVVHTVAMIQTIASQTNLLAMNAAIEAAHAGDLGKGFAVVADEVRSLAATTSKNVQTVSKNMKEMEEKIQNGVNAMLDAKKAFSSINSGVAETADIVRHIAESVEEQRLGTAETLSATQEVVQSISSIKELAVSQRQHTDNVYENTKNIVNSSNSISESLIQTTAVSENLNEILTDVNNCVNENTNSVEKMKTHINGFQTK